MSDHPSPTRLLTLAFARDGEGSRETSAHVKDCPRCARRRDELATLAEVVVLDAVLEEEVDAAPARASSVRGAERRDALARRAAESSAALAEADALLESAQDTDCDEVVRRLAASETGRLALLYAVQKGSFAAAHPHKALALANAVRDAAVGGGGEPRVSPVLLRAEASLLASQALLNIGRLGPARDAAISARESFRETAADPFALAVCDYFEASALSFQGEFARAERLLKSAARVFAEFAQDHWVGRAEAVLGATFAQRGNYTRALASLETAILRLDPDLDSNSYAVVVLSRARYLALLGRFEAARQGFAQALQIARAHRLEALVFAVRQNLAELDLLKGDLEKALASFRAVAEEADRQGLEEDQVVTRLAAAECLGRLGRADEMLAVLREISRRVSVTDLSGNPAWEELASRLDPGDIDVGLVAEVRLYLESVRDGFSLPFRRARRA